MRNIKYNFIELLMPYVIIILIAMFSQTLVSLGSTVPARMLLTLSVYIGIGAVIWAFIKKSRFSIANLKISQKHIGKQILIGLCIFAAIFLITVIIPMLMGMNKRDVLSFKSPSVQILIFYIFYDIFCVGLIEELAFRGYFYAKLESMTSKPWIPMLLSSIMFGFFHFPSTLNFLNVLVTTVIGLVYGICRWKIKNCTLLSLTIAHGLQDAAIVTFSFFLL